MYWNQVKHHFNGHPQDLVEAIFEDMKPDNWRLLFDWMDGKVSHVMTQHGYEEIEVIALNSFLSGEYSYVVTLKDELGLDLSIIEENQLDINVALEDIQSGASFDELLRCVIEIADVVKCSNYYLCPEFKKEEAFIINGKLS